MLFKSPDAALAFAASLVASDVDPAHVVYENSTKLKHISASLGGDHISAGDALVINIEGAASEAACERLLSEQGLSEENEYVARYLWNERFFPMKVRTYGPGMLGTELVVPQSRLLAVMACE